MTIKIQGTNSTAAPGITGGDTDTGVQFGTNEVKVVTGGTDRVTVDSTGNSLFKGEGKFVAAAGAAGGFRHVFNNAGYWLQNDSGASTFAIQPSDGAITTNAKFHGHLELDSTGSFTTPAVKLFADTGEIRVKSGGGINFDAYATSGNPSSNLLDDYEEGTFTPSFINYGSPSVSVAEGEYVKIGNSVFLSIRMTWTGGSNSGSSRISGLPFAMTDSHIKVNGWAQKNSEGSSVYRLSTTGASSTALYYKPIKDETSGAFYGTIQITSLS